MKKILLGAMVVLAFAACSQNEEFNVEGQQKQITFNGIVGKNTKATEVTTSNLDNFTVYGYYTNNVKKANVTSTDMEKLLMNNVKATKPADTWTLAGGPYYWPASGYTQFFAYSPSEGPTYNLAAGATSPSLTYTVAAEAANQKDLVVATLADQEKATGAVSLPFKHVLTQINFSAKATGALDYEVTSVKLTGVQPTGSYNFGDGQWTPSGEATNYVYLSSGNVNVTGADVVALTSGTSLMLIPQAVTGIKVQVDYNVMQNGILVASYTNKEVALTNTWVAGTKLRYTLALDVDGLVGISFTPSVDPDWSETTGE